MRPFLQFIKSVIALAIAIEYSLAVILLVALSNRPATGIDLMMVVIGMIFVSLFDAWFILFNMNK